jgi:hypothetical protein
MLRLAPRGLPMAWHDRIIGRADVCGGSDAVTPREGKWEKAHWPVFFEPKLGKGAGQEASSTFSLHATAPWGTRDERVPKRVKN